MVPVGPLSTLPEFDGLKASAVAIALTVFPEVPQMREKNVRQIRLLHLHRDQRIYAKGGWQAEVQSATGPTPPAE